MEMTARQIKKFIQLVYDNCGINLHDGKQQLLWARLSKRLRATGINSVEEYLNLLESDSRELMEFLDAISTNHTFFFRESRHFDLLGKEHQDIWCAASSSGEEPYSIAINCLEKNIKATILATDLSANVLQMVKNVVYPLDMAKNVAPHILKKYFKKGHGKWNGYIRVKDELKRMVTFKRYNLVTDPVISQEFDIIF